MLFVNFVLLLNGATTLVAGVLPYVSEALAAKFIGYLLGKQSVLTVWALPTTALGASVLWALALQFFSSSRASASPSLFGMLCYHVILLVFLFDLKRPKDAALSAGFHAVLALLTLIALLQIHGPAAVKAKRRS